MPLRRALATAALLGVGGLAGLGLAGCSGDDGASGSAATLATPTAPGDRPLVEVLEPGTGEQRVLSLSPSAAPSSDGSVGTEARIEISQQVARDQEVTDVPPITVPFTSSVTGVEGEGDEARISTRQTYAEPTVDGTGLDPADVAGVRGALAALTGTTSTLVVRPDGSTVATTSGAEEATAFDQQVRELVPVFPAEAVGTGARWTVTTVELVDGATVDQVATYTLASLEGDAYAVDASLQQTYRPGPVEQVEVSSGSGTLTAEMSGSLTQLLPASASGTLTSLVSYVVAGQTTELRSTATLGLTAG